MDRMDGRGSADLLAQQAQQDQLVRLDSQDRMAKMAKTDPPAHAGFPEQLAPKVWPVLPALTVRTETMVRLAHRGLAVLRVRLAQRELTAGLESQARTDSMDKTDGRFPLR